MIFTKNRRYKPIFKKFLALKQNVLYSNKLYKFRRRKWKNLIEQLTRLNKKFPKEYVLYDHTAYFLPYYSNYFKNNFRYNLQLKQRLKLIYVKLLKRFLKKKLHNILIKQTVKQNKTNNILNIVEFFENRLDAILYRSFFTSNIRIARQLILHKHVTVNKSLVTNPIKSLNSGDLIEISPKYHKEISKNILQGPQQITPKYLHINYRTFQILILEKISKTNTAGLHSFWLDLPTITKSCKT